MTVGLELSVVRYMVRPLHAQVTVSAVCCTMIVPPSPLAEARGFTVEVRGFWGFPEGLGGPSVTFRGGSLLAGSGVIRKYAGVS